MLQSIPGIFIFLFIAYIFSENRKKVPYVKIIIGIVLQILIGILLFKISFLQDIFFSINKLVLVFEKATEDGASFMFGYLSGGNTPFKIVNSKANFIIAFRVLPIVLVMSALSALLFHWGILQFLIKILSKGIEKTMKISAVQALGVGANIFLGIVEAPLFIKPYLEGMTRSSLFTVMTAGMATVAGTVMFLYASVIDKCIPNALGHILIASLMSAPAAVIFAQIMIPETQDFEKEAKIEIPKTTENAMDAIVKGTMEGLNLVLSIAAMIVVLFAIVSLINQFLGLFPTINGHKITIEYLISFIFIPITWLMGIPLEETGIASSLMSTKTVFTEFVSYQKFAGLKQGILSERSGLILTYAMCGFANFSSLGLIVGSMGTLVPNRRAEIVSLGFRSLISGTLATCTTGAIVGILIYF